MEKKICMEAEGKTLFIYPGKESASPAVYFFVFQGDGLDVLDLLRKNCSADFTFVAMGNLDWNGELSPWPADPAFRGGEAFKGRADFFLQQLVEKIIPRAESDACLRPSRRIASGYSLAGLFSLYALYKCTYFSSAACISPSMWFPGFLEFAKSGEMKVSPERIYFSLGDREALVKNPVLRTVQEKTESLVEHYRTLGFDVNFELNPGNHFAENEVRSARGIRWCLKTWDFQEP